MAISRTFRLTGLSAGSNTFKAQYHSDGSNTGTFDNRDITVAGIPN